MTNKEIIDARTKPPLPIQLSKFNPFWIRLKRPLGPPYLGDGKFATDRMSKEIIDDIYHETLAGKTIEQITEKIIVEYSTFVHCETVLNHVPKDQTAKWWERPTPKVDYIAQFEDREGIKRWRKKTEPVGTEIKEAYKPFIIWAIENSYGYWQLSKVLPLAPNSIRMWANKWGYAVDERTYTRTPDLTGKKSRTAVSGSSEDISDTNIDGPFTIDRSHKMLKFRKKFTGVGQIGMDFSRPGADINDLITVEGAIRFLNQKGFEVSLRPIILSTHDMVVNTSVKEIVGSLGQQ